MELKTCLFAVVVIFAGGCKYSEQPRRIHLFRETPVSSAPKKEFPGDLPSAIKMVVEKIIIKGTIIELGSDSAHRHYEWHSSKEGDTASISVITDARGKANLIVLHEKKQEKMFWDFGGDGFSNATEPEDMIHHPYLRKLPAHDTLFIRTPEADRLYYNALERMYNRMN